VPEGLCDQQNRSYPGAKTTRPSSRLGPATRYEIAFAPEKQQNLLPLGPPQRAGQGKKTEAWNYELPLASLLLQNCGALNTAEQARQLKAPEISHVLFN
jgi:hypothetical protein